MAYTTINKSTAHHDCNLYQANGSGKTISGMEFQPDMIFTKNRDSASYIPAIVDAVRGGTKKWFTCNANSESTDANAVTSFTSDGYVFGSSGSFNYSTDNYVNWCWKANGSGSANTDGDINSTVSVNQTAGFSIVKYTGNGSTNQTVGHGLGTTPKFKIIKSLGASAEGAVVTGAILGSTVGQRIFLNTTAAVGNPSGYYSLDTATTIGISGSNNPTSQNANGEDYIAYCFADVKGYSKFGSYSGNGSTNGVFQYLGFKPKWLMLKRTDGADWWGVFDSKRLGYNAANKHCRINEESYTEADKDVDQLSNGFKINTTDTAINASGGNYIYMAFGQSLVGSNNVPCTAR